MGYNTTNDEINAITKESIAVAYYELLQSEQNISVTMICEKAGVSRNAYYRNFNSTDEIILYCLILKWAKYCEINPVPPENGEVLRSCSEKSLSRKKILAWRNTFCMWLLIRFTVSSGQ